MQYIYVIAREGVKIGINFTSCSEKGNEIAQGAVEYYFAASLQRVEFFLIFHSCLYYHKASFIKVKI